MTDQEAELKLTDLDYLTSDHHLQMMKAALPYINVSEQRFLSMYIKFHELQNTVDLFEDQEVAAMGICSLDKQKLTPQDMLGAIRPYANPQEQSVLDLLRTLLLSEGKPPLDQLKSILSPDQQKQIDHMEMMMQAIQLMNAT